MPLYVDRLIEHLNGAGRRKVVQPRVVANFVVDHVDAQPIGTRSAT